jgi:hypothetical protein
MCDAAPAASTPHLGQQPWSLPEIACVRSRRQAWSRAWCRRPGRSPARPPQPCPLQLLPLAMTPKNINRLLRQPKRPPRQPRLRVTVLPHRSPHPDTRRLRRIQIRPTIEIDMIPSQRPRLLGPNARLQAQRHVCAQPMLLQVVSDLDELASILDRQSLRRPPNLPLGRIDQGGHVPAHQIARLRMPDRPRKRVMRDRHRRTGLLLRQLRQHLMNIVRGQLPQHSPPDPLSHRFEHMPILLDRLLRSTIKPGRQPVIKSLPHGVGGGGVDISGDLLTQRPELVPNLGLGPPAYSPSPALAVGGVPERHRSDPVPVRLIEVDAVLAVPTTRTSHTKETSPWL